MAGDRKKYFVDELKKHYQAAIASAHEAEVNAAKAADEVRKEARNKDDAKAAVEPGRMASGHRRRRQRAVRELETLIQFATGGVRTYTVKSAVGLGALVDVRIEGDDNEAAAEERTRWGPGANAHTRTSSPNAG